MRFRKLRFRKPRDSGNCAIQETENMRFRGGLWGRGWGGGGWGWGGGGWGGMITFMPARSSFLNQLVSQILGSRISPFSFLKFPESPVSESAFSSFLNKRVSRILVSRIPESGFASFRVSEFGFCSFHIRAFSVSESAADPHAATGCHMLSHVHVVTCCFYKSGLVRFASKPYSKDPKHLTV